MQEYQKSLETLKKPINVPYELETEKVGGLFNKEVQETGNVVISQEDFNAFQKQIEAAQLIKDDYEYIKSDKALNDLKNENSRLKEENKSAFETLTKANEVLEKRNKQIEKSNKILVVAREIISKLLKEIERLLGREQFVERVRGLGKDNEPMMNIMRNIDKRDNPQYYPEEQEQKHEKKNNRGMSR